MLHISVVLKLIWMVNISLSTVTMDIIEASSGSCGWGTTLWKQRWWWLNLQIFIIKLLYRWEWKEWKKFPWLLKWIWILYFLYSQHSQSDQRLETSQDHLWSDNINNPVFNNSIEFEPGTRDFLTNETEFQTLNSAAREDYSLRGIYVCCLILLLSTQF